MGTWNIVSNEYIFVQFLKTINERYVLSDRMDCYRHPAIMALFVNHWPPSPFTSLLPQTPHLPHAWCFPLDTFPVSQFNANLASSKSGITSGLWIYLTTGYDHTVTASWQCPSYPSCLLPCLPTSTFPNTPLLCPRTYFS